MSSNTSEPVHVVCRFSALPEAAFEPGCNLRLCVAGCLRAHENENGKTGSEYLSVPLRF